MTITLEQTRDMDIVKQIACDPRIWAQSCDDHSGKPEDYNPPADGAIYVLVRENGEIRGLWALVPRTHIRYEVHTMLLPELRGHRAIDAAARMAAWTWANTTAERIETEVPAVNAQALWFARTAGMQEYGRNPQSFRKDGILYETVLLGISRPKELTIEPR